MFKSIKYFISLSLIALSFSAQAAFMVCRYQAGPCDQFGNHYTCTLIGWTGQNPPKSCSAIDKSSGPGRSTPDFDQSVPVENPSCDDCKGYPKPNPYCIVECGCPPTVPFCGAW